MNSALDPAMWMRRRRVLSLPLLMVLAPAPLLAQEVLPLKPNEPIDFPGASRCWGWTSSARRALR